MLDKIGSRWNAHRREARPGQNKQVRESLSVSFVFVPRVLEAGSELNLAAKPFNVHRGR